MTSTRKITLMSSDMEKFEVEEAVAVESQTLKDMIKEEGDNDMIPLPIVSSKIVAMVLEYCRKHAESRLALGLQEEELKKWDTEFIKVDHATLFDLIKAANYLNIKGLLDLACQKVVDVIKGNKPEEISETSDIKKDFARGRKKSFAVRFNGPSSDNVIAMTKTY